LASAPQAGVGVAFLAAQIEIVGQRIDLLHLLREKRRVKRIGDGFGNFVLHCKDVF
jgi:hypothetical protein